MKSPGWILGVALLAAAPMASPLPAASQVVIAPGSSAQGARLLQEKACLNCHAFNGRGGTSAPDLAQRSPHSYTPTGLASVLWNHSPSMWNALDAKNLTLPLMSSTDTADLFAYFYSSLYFDVPGDAARGKAAFENKNCAGCHSTGQPHKVLMAGPPIADWIEVKDPLMWAERMWNHSYEMYHATWDVGVKYPQLTTQNVADIMAYLSGLPAARSQNASFQPGSPDRGRLVFERDCETCHTFGSIGSTQSRKIDLLSRPAPRTLAGYIAAMWNHAPSMRRASGDQSPKLAGTEMNDLTAYLFAQRYFLEKGNPRLGAEVYRTKQCVVCHEQDRAQTHAPELTQLTERFSAVTLTSALWRHGPAMMEAMKARKIAWPEFHGAEMTNLIAFLNGRLLPHIVISRD